MASACVNNIGMSPENFLDCPAAYPSYGWLSPRISFSRELPDEDSSRISGGKPPSQVEKSSDPKETKDPDVSGMDFVDFEFRLDDPVTMLPADELFSDGKLMPLHLAGIRSMTQSLNSLEIRSPAISPEVAESRRRAEVYCNDPYLFSPKAPRCSSRWKELLGLKKLYQNSNPKQNVQKTASTVTSHSLNNPKSLKYFLHRHTKSSSAALDSSLSVPLLKDSDSESVSISSRLSLSSSSSGHEVDDLPRLSLDSEKPNLSQIRISLAKNTNPKASNSTRVRSVRPRTMPSDNPASTRASRSPLRRAPESSTETARGVSVDSPRMNSSGKIVFQGLGRSSSSPSTFNGGPRVKHRGMERSYSANVRVTPVLNVPICSLRGSSKSGVFGFPIFTSPQKRDSGVNGGSRPQSINNRNRTDRI